MRYLWIARGSCPDLPNNSASLHISSTSVHPALKARSQCLTASSSSTRIQSGHIGNTYNSTSFFCLVNQLAMNKNTLYISHRYRAPILVRWIRFGLFGTYSRTTRGFPQLHYMLLAQRIRTGFSPAILDHPIKSVVLLLVHRVVETAELITRFAMRQCSTAYRPCNF